MSRDSGVLVAEAWDRIDGTNAEDFERALREAISEEDRALVVDMGQLGYISSAGLRAILVIAKMLGKQQGKISICSLQAPIREVFAISGFDKIIPIYESRADAVGS